MDKAWYLALALAALPCAAAPDLAQGDPRLHYEQRLQRHLQHWDQHLARLSRAQPAAQPELHRQWRAVQRRWQRLRQADESQWEAERHALQRSLRAFSRRWVLAQAASSP